MKKSTYKLSQNNVYFLVIITSRACLREPGKRVTGDAVSSGKPINISKSGEGFSWVNRVNNDPRGAAPTAPYFPIIIIQQLKANVNPFLWKICLNFSIFYVAFCVHFVNSILKARANMTQKSLIIFSYFINMQKIVISRMYTIFLQNILFCVLFFHAFSANFCWFFKLYLI